MTSSLKKARALQIAGIAAVLLALLDDSYLHLPGPLFALLVVAGIACFAISYWMRRHSTPAPAVLTMAQKHRAFVIFLALGLLGCAVAEFLLPSPTPHLSPVTRVLIGASTVALIVGILIWRIYLPGRGGSTQRSLTKR